MKVFSATDIGQKRQMNQDFIYTSEEPVGNLPNLFVVADGMGGHNAGDFASRYGVSVLVETVRKDKNFNPVKIIRNGIEAANREVLDQSRKDPSMSGMGTTMVAATVVGGYAYVANVGDSRLYLIHDGSIRQITRDHSYVEEMVAMGMMQRGSADYNRKKNIITRAAGIRPDIVPDFFEEELEQGDYILLCSDGLSNMVDNDTLCSIILSEGSLKEKAQRLIAEANERGGTDNIAVVLVKPEEGGMGSC